MKEEVSLTAKKENMENPRALVHAETQHEVALVTEGTGLLEETPYENLFLSEHQYDDRFAASSVSVTYSYEGTVIFFDPV